MVFRRRPDGRLAQDVPPYRRIMPLIMRTRTESTVAFDLEVDLAKTLPFLERWNAAHPDARATPFHVIVRAIVETLARRPELNRFVAGGRLWDRDGIYVSFAAKQRQGDETAPLVTVKRRLEPGRPLEDVVGSLRQDVAQGRSGRETASDKEVRLITKLPITLQRALYALFRWADDWGLLPRSMIDPDPLYTSVFVGNLGSLKMDACQHHLYEHGTASVFCVIGQTKSTPVVRDGGVATRTTLALRFTFDERATDGLYAQRALEMMKRLVEDPEGKAETTPGA